MCALQCKGVDMSKEENNMDTVSTSQWRNISFICKNNLVISKNLTAIYRDSKESLLSLQQYWKEKIKAMSKMEGVAPVQDPLLCSGQNSEPKILTATYRQVLPLMPGFID